MAMITILGPTASGKTRLAVATAAELHTEIVSGDSRQVYRMMDLGTGKDLNDYTYHNRHVPYHLIDIAEPGSKYTLFDFQRDFTTVYKELRGRGLEPVFCGGSGLYVESVIRAYRLSPAPVNQKLRDSLKDKSLSELTQILASCKTLHNTTDVDTCARAIRAIEIEYYNRLQPAAAVAFPEIDSVVIGVSISREVRRKRITERLAGRINDGMIYEVRRLLDSGIPPEDLIYYGLEYKFLTYYLIGRISFEELSEQLETAIHQFAKRQMTWFRGMERRGVVIHWIDGSLPVEENVKEILRIARDGIKGEQ